MATTETNNKQKKVLSALGFAFALVLFALALCVFILSLQAKKENRQVEFFGYSFSVVLTDSMEPEIKVGDLVVVKSCDISEVELGENVVFIQRSGVLRGQRVIHEAVKIDTDAEGLYIRTQGVNENITSMDADYVRADNLVGVEVFHSTVLGWIVRNWIILVVLAILIPIAVKQIKNICKYVADQKAADSEASESSERSEGSKK